MNCGMNALSTWSQFAQQSDVSVSPSFLGTPPKITLPHSVSQQSPMVGVAQRVSLTPSAIRSFKIDGPAGDLEAVLNDGSPDAPFTALVCHPHPLFGGTLHNKVVYHAMKALNDPAWGLGLPVLRFNFRGVGLSKGVHHGKNEVEDVVAALAWLKREFDLPILLAGFSFGAVMALRACHLIAARSETSTTHSSIHALIALGLPTLPPSGPGYQSYLPSLTLPKLLLSGGSDQFAPVAELEQLASLAAEPRRLILIPHADHFFTDQLEPMQRALAGWSKEQMP